jgi:glycosyltransferase involved in cell wall biosynthesis
VIYNGVDAAEVLGLSTGGLALVTLLGLLDSDLNLLMPVRVTRAKNIEYAMHTAAELRAMNCRVRLVVTGPPDPHDQESMRYFESLQELREQLGLVEEVRFVFECGTDVQHPLIIDAGVVGELYRASDVMFMPSHREGFGMPVLEAGLTGIPVVCTDVPAAREIAPGDATLIDAADTPREVATQILRWAEQDRVHRLRRRVRRGYTWGSIFKRDIAPLLRDKAGIGDS